MGLGRLLLAGWLAACLVFAIWTTPSLAQEIGDAFKREGTAINTRENIHRMAEANKAFAHYRW